jgi:hypothetical protein
MTEDQIQAKFFQTAWNELPQTRNLLFAVPNGGQRDIREAQKFKATGLLAGIPDMMFLWKEKAYGFELKAEGGRLSPAQHKVHDVWSEQLIPVYVIWSSEQGMIILREILSN